jgi:hypothetical protein
VVSVQRTGSADADGSQVGGIIVSAVASPFTLDQCILRTEYNTTQIHTISAATTSIRIGFRIILCFVAENGPTCRIPRIKSTDMIARFDRPAQFVPLAAKMKQAEAKARFREPVSYKQPAHSLLHCLDRRSDLQH